MEPEDLVRARQGVAENPRDAGAWLALGRAAAVIGNSAEAAIAFKKAYPLDLRSREAAAAGLLNLYADYGSGVDPAKISLLVTQHPDSSAVLLAGVAALRRAERPRLAQALLEEGGARFPDDSAILRALRPHGP